MLHWPSIPVKITSPEQSAAFSVFAPRRPRCSQYSLSLNQGKGPREVWTGCSSVLQLPRPIPCPTPPCHSPWGTPCRDPTRIRGCTAIPPGHPAGSSSQAEHNLSRLLAQGLISAAETGGFLPTSQNRGAHTHLQEEKGTEEGHLSGLLNIPCGEAKKKQTPKQPKTKTNKKPKQTNQNKTPTTTTTKVQEKSILLLIKKSFPLQVAPLLSP